MIRSRFYIGHTLTCVTIAANALCSGAIFTFPLMSPGLASQLKLTQPQLTTIVLAGMIGQYPFSAVAGKIVDRYGPSACSLIASILFSLSFGISSWEISEAPQDISIPISVTSFHRLVVLFWIAGLGTVFGYFSSLFAATKNFPNYLGIASGTSMALFGLSPLFLSLVASRFFTNPDMELNTTQFLEFLAILTGTVHMIGFLNLNTPFITPSTSPLSSVDNSGQAIVVDERARLLSAADFPISEANTNVIVEEMDHGFFQDLLCDRYFWLLALILVFTLGSSEMVISNIGTIALSLPHTPLISSPQYQPSTVSTATQVRILSLANTCSRIIVGPFADFVSPVTVLSTSIRNPARKHLVSRIVFLSSASLLLTVAFFCMEVAVRSQEGVWVLSIGTGIAYGTIFTVLPSIVSSIWGLSNSGRNFGILTYSPFIGTPIFSYLYAFISARHSQHGGICEGIYCWQLTFWICCGSSAVAFCGTLILWRNWKGKV